LVDDDILSSPDHAPLAHMVRRWRMPMRLPQSFEKRRTEMKSRFVLAMTVLFAFIGLGPAMAGQSLEVGVNRPGNDMRSFQINPKLKAEWDTCVRACSTENGCQSVTLVNPGIQGPNFVCWLKRGVPAKRADKCCTSSVVQKSLEPGIDRGGADYKTVELASNDFYQCQATCKADGKCQAWTFVRAGLQGPKAKCWLKSAVPDARVDSCCFSGVMFRGSSSVH
jgi:hypothetical protein